MKKLLAVLFALMLFVGVSFTTVYAGGDQNHGDVGQGDVDQGDTGGDVGNAPGDDAQGNQAG